jgi:hypothetical protein
VDFGGLAVWVPCSDALAEGLEATHLVFSAAAGVVTRPALPECPAVVPGGTQGFISGDCGGAVRFPGATVLADRNDRGGLAVDDGSVTAAGIQGKTTVAEASRSFDLSPSEIEGWVEDAKRGMENSLRANRLISASNTRSS